MSKFENLVSGVHSLAHAGEIDEQGLVVIASKLNGEAGDVTFDEAHELFRNTEKIAQLEEHYEILDANGRRDIGRTVNSVRIR